VHLLVLNKVKPFMRKKYKFKLEDSLLSIKIIEVNKFDFIKHVDANNKHYFLSFSSLSILVCIKTSIILF
jgi:hypothetical protein